MVKVLALTDGWQLAHTPPSACAGPEALIGFPAQWREAQVPGTVASSIHEDINDTGNYDADDWWYRATFARPDGPPGTRYRLRLDGLATIAEVWLNGVRIAESRNMFVGLRVDVTDRLVDVNQIAIVFRSLEREVKVRRARPRWKTALVGEQNLRWFRTTLLGRMPGWTPPITCVGPWQPVVLECFDAIDVESVDVQPFAEGGVARLKVRAEVASLRGAIEKARIILGERSFDLECLPGVVKGDLTIPEATLWYPHTHGTPALAACAIELLVDGAWHRIDCGKVGFKEIALDTAGGAVRYVVNGVPVFARGACWTTTDFLTLRGDAAKLRQALTLARDAGLNMLRVGGTMVYESDAFYALCDELGILVWQDFMFANMDYPVADAGFREEIEREVAYQLGRFSKHACLAAYCGGSEIAQQAAMMGLAREQWLNEFFAERLPQLCARFHAGIPYFPSTPWGGALPMHSATGIAHYYGVGAYRRPLMDVKAAKVKFASECLGFSNVPDAETMALVLDGSTLPPPHHPRWKARVPRDNGSGYDFEDVRDHYLKELFGKDPIALRNQDLERYYAVSRVVTGEVMGRVFSEWRAPASTCGGALVWFYRDLLPGAGWGITDSEGRPKAAYWYLKRAWAPRTIRLTDEGLDGLAIHVINESDEPMDALVELEMFQSGRIPTAAAEATVRVPARGAVTLQGDALLGYFSDATNAYRFGPPKHDVIAVRLKDSTMGIILAEDYFFPAGMDLAAHRHATITSEAAWRADGTVAVTLKSDVFLQSVSISSPGFLPDDDYFHLSPGNEKVIVFTPQKAGLASFKAHFEPLNWPDPITVRAQASTDLSHPREGGGPNWIPAFAGMTGSGGLDAARPDDPAPLLRLLGDELAEVGGRATDRRGTEVGEARLHLGIREGRVHHAIDLLHDVCRRALGHEDAVPPARFVAGYELSDGGQVRKSVGAGGGRHSQGAELARLDVLDRRGQGLECDLHLPAEKIGEGLRAALVGNVDEGGAGHRLEELAGEMLRGAVAGRALVDLVRVRFRIGDEFRDRARRKGRRHRHDVGKPGDAGDGCQVRDEVEGELVVERGIDRVHRAAHQQRVAVRGRAHHRLGREVAARAGAVLHEHRLVELIRHPLRDEPRHDVEVASAAKPTRIRTGRAGQDCAHADRAAHASAAEPSAHCRTLRRDMRVICLPPRERGSARSRKRA
jgi:beta-mannosidase